MAPETREWSVPAPVRMLMWWPAISFVLVIVNPDAATGGIVVAGAALALLGGLVGAVANRLRANTPALAVEGPPLAETTIEITPAAVDVPAAENSELESTVRRRAA